jgi:hypothetical protein
MERVVDLDRAADEVAERRPGWSSRGLVVGPVTWRDESAPWPQRLETERSRVGDPDSIGVHFSGSGGAELVIVLFRGGWADVDFIATLAALSLTACTSTGSPTAATAATTAASSQAPASTPTPDSGKTALEAAVRAYSKAYFAGNATTGYAMLSKRCTAAVDKDVYAVAIATEAKAYGKQTIKTLTVEQLSGDLARVSYTYSVPLLNQKSQPWTREGGTWHYDAC